jgi:outer membrane protein assembly factor BamB
VTLRHGSIFQVLLILAIPAFSACDPPPPAERSNFQFRGNPEHTGVFDGEGPIELGGELWRFMTMGPVRSSPAISGSSLYIGSTDGILYALDRATGTERWQADVASPVSSSPAVAAGLVVFGSRDGVFHAVDQRSGRPSWRFETGQLLPWEWGFEGWDVYTSSPSVAGDLVVFGAGDGVVYALDLPTGAEAWRFETGGRIRSTPAIADGVAFVGSTDGRVYAIDLETGQERWVHETDGAAADSEGSGVDRKSIIASPAVAGGTVYVGSRDGYLYALDQGTGERKWRFSHDGSWAMSSVAVEGETLFSGTSDGRWVHAVDTDTGEERWRSLGEGYTWSSPWVAGETVFIGDGGGFLLAVDRQTGEERWRYPVGGGVYSSPVVMDGKVYFGADDGNVYALRGGGPFPRRAVYWDEALLPFSYFPSHLETRVFFEQLGYEILDADGLADFLDSRIEDGLPSVFVAAMDHLPPSVAGEPSDTVLFRRYLEAGGKVVWLGLPPTLLARDESGRVTAMDRARPSMLLGVEHGAANFDFYATQPTELGRSWGLDRGWVSTLAINASDDIQILGLDENGRAGVWVRSFGGPEGTGFVGMGLPSATPENLIAVKTVAEYGLERGGR